MYYTTYAYSFFFFSSRRRHTRLQGDWSSDVCSSDLYIDGRQSFSICRKRQCSVAARIPRDRVDTAAPGRNQPDLRPLEVIRPFLKIQREKPIAVRHPFEVTREHVAERRVSADFPAPDIH